MKYLKMLGLAVVAIAALSAFAAGSASATELCSKNESPCGAGNKYGVGTEIKSSLKAGKIATLTGTFAVECEESAIEGKVENEGGAAATVSGKISKMTFTKCGNCTVTVNKNPTLEAHSTGGGNGSITAIGFEVSITCLGVTCKYGGNIEANVTAAGGNPAVITATKAAIPVTGGAGEFFCGKKGEWDAEYEVTTPKPMFVV
jgi:hypothetical protein